MIVCHTTNHYITPVFFSWSNPNLNQNIQQMGWRISNFNTLKFSGTTLSARSSSTPTSFHYVDFEDKILTVQLPPKWNLTVVIEHYNKKSMPQLSKTNPQPYSYFVFLESIIRFAVPLPKNSGGGLPGRVLNSGWNWAPT